MKTSIDSIMPFTTIGLVCWGMIATVDGQEHAPNLWEGLVFKQPEIPASITGVIRDLNQHLSSRTTPSENVVVPLVQLFGADAFAAPLRADSLSMLGISELSKTAPRFIYPEEFINSIDRSDPQDSISQAATLQRQVCECSERIWRPEQFPQVADFLKANQPALDLLVESADRPGYYAPMLSETEPPRLMSASLVIERRLPLLVHAVTARAMLELAEHQTDKAIKDLLACHRLAVLLATGSPFDVSVVKAHILEGITNQAVGSVLENGQMTAEAARAYLIGRKAIPSLPYPEYSANLGERAILHQEIELMHADDQTVLEFFELTPDAVPTTDAVVSIATLPMKPAIQRADEIQDQYVRALSIRNRLQQYHEFQRLDDAFQEWQKTSDEASLKVATEAKALPEAASRWIGETLGYSLRPWYWQRRIQDDRVRVRRDLVTIGTALVAYHHEHQAYPQKLEDLVPQYLEFVPLDAHSDTPFVYERLNESHARMLSWGANQRDDAGMLFNDDLFLNLN